MNFAKNKTSSVPATHRWLIAAIIFVLFSLFAAGLTFKIIYAERIYPGVYLGNIYIGGLKPEEAAKKINKIVDTYLKKGFLFQVSEKRVSVNPLIIAPEDPDLYYELATFKTETMVDTAFRFGRGVSEIKNIHATSRALIFKKNIPLNVSLDKERLNNILKQNFSSLEEPPREAAWKISFGEDGALDFVITEESPGFIYRYDDALRSLEEKITNLIPVEIELQKQEAFPQIIKNDVASVIPEAKKILSVAPLTIVASTSKWNLYPQTVSQWLTIKKIDGVAKVDLREEGIKESLKNWGKQYALEQEPRNAKFKLEKGKVVEFQSSQNGSHIVSEENINSIRLALLSPGRNKTIVLKNDVTEPEFRTDEVNALGIRELIGVAKTSFAGSPKNRRHNIKMAVDKLNGLLIPDGEEFSLVRAIGNIDKEAGFKEELVIKGDKTTPEFGGGLCQIATTVFRSALLTGLPILERQNHSYRVPYYEPPVGMDATIYLPKPDLVFKNNTGASILILGSISGDKLEFEFWGTSDGRLAETSKPIVKNIVPPPPPKLVLTEELPPGVKKCTERAHAGALASFTYTVTRADGTREEKIFRSHYRPWQEVCLLGVAPGKATSTEKAVTRE